MAPFCCPLKKFGSKLIAMVVSSLQSIQDEFFIDSMECVHQGFEHEMDMSRQYDGSFWQEWKIKFIKLFVEKCTPHGLKSGIIDMMGNVQEKFSNKYAITF